MSHIYESHTAHGYGRWHTCQRCGTAKHGGNYWLAGFKSRTEPPCEYFPINAEWKAKATTVPLEEIP